MAGQPIKMTIRQRKCVQMKIADGMDQYQAAAACGVTKPEAVGIMGKDKRVGKKNGGPVGTVKKAAKKVQGTGALMTKKEQEELLNMTKKKPVAKKKTPVKKAVRKAPTKKATIKKK